MKIIDTSPVVNDIQLKHWQWISDYYMCSEGEVMKAAMPSAFFQEGEINVPVMKDTNQKKKHLLNWQQGLQKRIK